MPSHAWMAAKLLRGAATFFRTWCDVQPEIAEELKTNANSCDRVADLVEKDPLAEAPKLVDGEEGGVDAPTH